MNTTIRAVSTRRAGTAFSIIALLLPAAGAHAAGDVARGALAVRACMACHSFVAGRHMTGPSLAHVWGSKAGAADGFSRYSAALKKSGVVWDLQHLDAWLTNQQALIAGNAMTFAGIGDAGTRADILAYLQAVSEGRVVASERALPKLRTAAASSRVSTIRYCGDNYRVTTNDQQTHLFWEFNLRFKTDGSANGPEAGKPVIVGGGMQGDRAAVVFASPGEISSTVRQECP